MDIVLKEIGADHEDLHGLIDRLDGEIGEMYPAEGIFGVDFSDPKVHEMVFVVAYAGGRAVGCGGIRALDGDSVELKRFFVDRAYRGQGIASRLLAYLEGVAKDKGYRLVKLETGPKQLEAIALYEKYGYRQIPLFGEYNDSRYSVCYEKAI